ncbi:MAG: hypothetical protein QM730_10945 [Anaerolineales bacterium]
MNDPKSKRKLIIIVSAVDAFISGILLLIYFGFLPVDLSKLGIQNWFIGLFAGIWFLVSISILTYQVTRTDGQE